MSGFTIHEKEQAEDYEASVEPGTDLIPDLERYGELLHELDLLGVELDETSLAKKIAALRAEANDLGAQLRKSMEEEFTDVEQDGIVSGKQITAKLSKASNSTKVTAPEKLVDYLKSLGKDEFLSLVHFKITELRDYLPGVIYKKVTTTARTGSRSFKITKK